MMQSVPLESRDKLNGVPMNDVPVPANVEVIRVHVGELRQMFNSMDPAPFHARDLDPDAEVYIVESANDLSHKPVLASARHAGQHPARSTCCVKGTFRCTIASCRQAS